MHVVTEVNKDRERGIGRKAGLRIRKGQVPLAKGFQVLQMAGITDPEDHQRPFFMGITVHLDLGAVRPFGQGLQIPHDPVVPGVVFPDPVAQIFLGRRDVGLIGAVLFQKIVLGLQQWAASHQKK